MLCTSREEHEALFGDAGDFNDDTEDDFEADAMAAGLDKGVIQCRLSEALTLLPVLFPSAVPGLFVGCFAANLLTGCALWDVAVGSLTTLVAAILTRKFRKNIFLATLPPIVLNALTVPPVISFVYGAEESIPFIALTVFLGELISAGVLGNITLKEVRKRIKLDTLS